MKTIIKITKNELSMLFCSPIAWLILVIFVFQSGMTFTDILTNELKAKAVGYALRDETASIFSGFRGLFSQIQQYLYLYIPLLTMGIMSKEYSNGSIKLLFSSPITNRQIVLGKFYALLVYAFVLIGSLALIVIFCGITVKDMDFSLVLSGLLGLYLLTCAYAAIGLFMSSLTSYQVVAAIGTLAVLALLSFISTVGQDIALVRDITYWLSISGRANELVNGLICSEDVIYFLVVILLFLWISILKLHYERKRSSLAKIICHYTVVVVGAMFVGYLSSRPALMTYYDATAMKSQTLTPRSQAVMEKMEGDLTITTYVNLLEKNYMDGLPRSVLYDQKRFKKYVRFKPEIKMKYVYYYDKAENPELDLRYPKLNDEERAKALAKSMKLNFDMFLSPEEIRKQIDLSGEGNRFVRLLKRGNGQKTFLRLYNDMNRHPYESQISSALKRLVTTPPKVLFFTGHGERNVYKGGDGDLFTFTKNYTFRHALINQGFDIDTLSLQRAAASLEADVVVIADPSKAFSEEEKQKIEQYIASGKDMIIAGKPGNQAILNPILAHLGLQFTPGIIVQPSENFDPDLIFGNFTPAALKFSGNFAYLAGNGYKITSPCGAGIAYVADKGFQVVPLVVTDSTGCWNELETTDFINEVPTFDPRKGETTCGKTPIVVILARKVGEKLQKIVVLGNADCIGNSELVKSRKDVKSANFSFILEMFRWFSNGEFPVDTNRAYGPDNDIRLDYKNMLWVKVLYMGLIPIILAGIGVLVLMRRKRE